MSQRQPRSLFVPGYGLTLTANPLRTRLWCLGEHLSEWHRPGLPLPALHPVARPARPETTPTTKPARTPGISKPNDPSGTAPSTSGGMPVPDGLGIGTIAGAREGQLVSVVLGKRACASVG